MDLVRLASDSTTNTNVALVGSHAQLDSQKTRPMIKKEVRAACGLLKSHEESILLSRPTATSDGFQTSANKIQIQINATVHLGRDAILRLLVEERKRVEHAALTIATLDHIWKGPTNQRLRLTSTLPPGGTRPAKTESTISSNGTKSGTYPIRLGGSWSNGRHMFPRQQGMTQGMKARLNERP